MDGTLNIIDPEDGFGRQHSIAAAVSCTGTALHSGRDVTLQLVPAPAGSGIVIRRTDLSNGGSTIDVCWERVVDTQLATTVGNDYGTRVSTIEHLMAALAGCGIDNIVIELDGDEMPAMDGSSAPFVDMIERAGIVAQAAPRRAIRVLKTVRVEDGEKSIEISPDDGFSVSFEIGFEGNRLTQQERFVENADLAFRDELADARTFGFKHEVDQMHSMGLARGGSLENAVVVDGETVLNEGGLRHSDEFVRHKILDCIGDLYLAGGPLIGRVTAVKSGHDLNNQLLRALFADPDAWCWDGAADAALPLQNRPEIAAQASV